jgi:putative membrane protein
LLGINTSGDAEMIEKEKILWIIGGVLVLLIVLGGLGYGSYSGYGMMGGNWGWGMGMGLGMLLLWGVIIWLVVVLVERVSSRGEDASEILRKRYARGDITKKEYEEMKKELK